MKEQESSLNQRSTITQRETTSRNTATQITAGLHQWNWTLLNDVKRRILGESKVIEIQKRAIHVANRATSQEIVVQRTW